MFEDLSVYFKYVNERVAHVKTDRKRLVNQMQTCKSRGLFGKELMLY